MKGEPRKRISDEHKFPFSLLSAGKEQITKLGDVSEQMDKSIGRPVYRIKGAISANNFVEIDQVHLVGPFVYVQLCLQSPTIATFHLEVITTANVNVRLSVSTMYDGEQPRFLGRSLRLPLPKVSGWMVLILDLNQIINRFCASAASANTLPIGLQSIKKLQLCSNMVLRDVVTSDRLYSPQDPVNVPKELSVKPGGVKDSAVAMHWVDLLLHCQKESVAVIPSAVTTPTRNEASSKATRLQRNMHLLKNSPQAAEGSASPLIASALRRTAVTSTGSQEPETESDVLLETSRSLRDVALTTEDLLATVTKTSVHTESSAAVVTTHSSRKSSSSARSSTALSPTEHKSTVETIVTSSRFCSASQVRLAQSAHLSTPQKRDLGRPADSGSRAASSPYSGSAVMRHLAPETSPADRLLTMERLLGYAGGPSVLLYDGRMMVLSSGPLLVLVDLDKQATPTPINGLWKAFKIKGDSEGSRGDGHLQSILRGHGQSVGVVEVSDRETLMATVETSSCPATASRPAHGPLLILWDLTEGRRLMSMRPHVESIVSVAFSPDCAMLVTAGTDAQFRYQVIVWDLQQLLLEKSVVVGHSNSAAALIIARQISEFHISNIRFSPFEDFSLVSCGRENIRFWRMRKGHLPGRPVLLNEYSRGFVFGQMAFNMDSVSSVAPGEDASSAVVTKRPTVYVSSNKGMLLRVNCTTCQVLCAFQLHASPIRSLCIRFGYAVTGGDDRMLRVWPLDFSDFLLEAQHEGPITSIRVSTDGRTQAIGTSAGTLGILNVSDHSYNTVLRSHVGPITRVASRGPNWFEFATLGCADHTVRVWDALSASQVIEFDCEQDEPTALCYHPVDHVMACGFASGFMRLFNVTSAAVICEHKSHSAPLSALSYLSPVKGVLLLISAGLDGALVVYNAAEDHSVIRTIAVIPNALSATLSTLKMVVNHDHSLVALASSAVASIVVLETLEFTVATRLSPMQQQQQQSATSSPLPASPTPSESSPPPVSAPLGGGLHSGSSHFAATTLFPIGTAATGGEGGGGSVTAAVIGMFFSQPCTGAVSALVVVTDRHLIAIPMGGAGVATASRVVARPQKGGVWEGRFTRRIDFGRPTRVVFDPQSSLLFMAVHAPVASTKRSSGPQLTDRLDETANSFVVLNVQVQTGSLGPKLSVSTVQLYRDLPSAVQDISPCLHCGRVVTVDDAGCIVLWEARSDNLDKFAHPIFGSRTVPSTNEYFLEQLSPQEQKAGDSDEGNDNEVNAFTSAEDQSWRTPSTNRSARPQEEEEEEEDDGGSPSALATLTRDFELAARHDPAMWSTGSVAQPHSAVAALSTAGPVVGEGATRFSAMYDWEEATPGPGSSSKKNPPMHSSGLGADLNNRQPHISDEQQGVDADEASADEALSQSASRALLLPPKRSVTEAHVVHRHTETTVVRSESRGIVAASTDKAVTEVTCESVARDYQELRDLMACGPDSSPQTVVAGDCAVEMQALCHRHTTAPSLNVEHGVVVATDGSSVFITHFGAEVTNLALRVPSYLLQFEQCDVIDCSLSPTGDCVASVVRVLSRGPQASSSSSAAYCLLVWRLDSRSSDSCAWSLAGLAELGTTCHVQVSPAAKNHSETKLDWTGEGDLVVALSLALAATPSRRAEDVLRLAVVSRGAIGEGRVQDAVRATNCDTQCPVSSGVSFLKVLPRSQGVERLSLMITSLSKLLYVIVSANGPRNGYSATVLWSEDVGNRGPFLGMGVAAGSSAVLSSPATASRKHSAQEFSRRVVALLDSCGSVRFVEVFWGDDLTETPQLLPPRVVSISIAAAHASGALQSLAVTYSSQAHQMQMVLGATHTIRVFSVQIRDLNARSIAAQVTLMAKISCDFRADFCHFAIQPLEKARSVCPRLIVACYDGQLGFTRSKPLPADKSNFQFVSVRNSLPAESVAGRTVVDLLLSRDTRSVVVRDSSGHLSLHDPEHGIKITAAHNAMLASSMCESFGSLFAAGTRCGKVVLMDAQSMEGVQTVDLAPGALGSVSVSASLTSLRGGARTRAHQGSDLSQAAVTGISSLADGSALLLAQHNGDLSLVQLYPGQKHDPIGVKIPPSVDFAGPFLAPESLRNISQTATIVATCFGDNQMGAAVRKGSNVLELHRTDHYEDMGAAAAAEVGGFSFAADGSSRRKSYWNNVLNVSLKTADGDLCISACNLVFQGRLLLISAVGLGEEDSNESVGLFHGSLQIPTSAPLSVSGTTSPLRVILTRQQLRGPTSSESAGSICAHHFLGGLVAAAHMDGIDVWDWIEGEGHQPLSEPRLVFSAPLAQVTFGATREWQKDLVIRLESLVNNQGARLRVYRNKNPALFIFNL